MTHLEFSRHNLPFVWSSFNKVRTQNNIHRPFDEVFFFKNVIYGMFPSDHYKLPSHLLFLNRAFYQMASRVVNPDPEKYRGPRGLLIDFDTL